MSIVVPKKVYIDYQERTENGDTVKLGFATYADKEDKAFLKRKDTIDAWASRPLSRYVYDETTGKRKHVKDEPKYGAEYIDNEPRSGFKIPRHVRRWGWNGGNVVWRIEDPRGFELEIPSENMGQLLMHCAIKNGEVQDECVWGWNKTGGSRVVLLPVNSEPYTEALKDTLLHNNSVSIRDVNIGDRIVLKNGAEGIFLGGHHYIAPEYMPSHAYTGWNQNRRRDPFVVDDAGATGYGYDGKEVKSFRRHFLKLDDGNFYIQSGFKVALIKERSPVPFTQGEAFVAIDQAIALGKQLTTEFEEQDNSWRTGDVGEFGVTQKKNEFGKFSLVSTTLDEIKQKALGNQHSVFVIYEHEGDLIATYVHERDFTEDTPLYNRAPSYFYKEYLDDGRIITSRIISDGPDTSKKDAASFDRNNTERKYYFLTYILRNRMVIVDC